MVTTLPPVSLRSAQQAARPAAAMQRQAYTAPPSVQFKGLDDKYFKMMMKISLGFWAALTTAVGTGVGTYFVNQAPSVQTARTVNNAFASSQREIEASLKALASAPSDQLAEKAAAHQKLVKTKVIEQAQLIQSAVGSQAANQAISDVLKQTTLSPEERAATEALLQGKGFEGLKDPADAFDRWADTVLSKRIEDKNVLNECKQTARELFKDARVNQAVSRGLLVICVAGSLVSAGTLGLAAMGGSSGVGMLLLFGPLFAFGVLRESLFGKKKPTTPPPAEKTPEPALSEAEAPKKPE